MEKKKSRFAGLELGTGEGGRSGGIIVRDADYYLAAALEHELAGRHDKALTQYSAALGEDPLCIKAWSRQLWMLLYLEELREAEVWAEKALKLFPIDPDILALKSIILWRTGIVDEAKLVNDIALQGSIESANVWLARAELQLQMNMKSAMACLKHAFALPGDKGLNHLRAGDILVRRRKYIEAAECYRNATQAYPESAWAWYGYGRTQRALGSEGPARIAFERAFTLAPRDGRYREAKKKRPGLWRRFRMWIAGKI